MGLLFTAIFILLPHSQLPGLQKFLDRLEGIAYDVRLLATLPEQPRSVDAKVVIIDIDEKSMREQGRFPWTRTKIAELTEKLMAAGVVVAAFDVFFSEPETNAMVELSQTVPELQSLLQEKLPEIIKDVDADLRFQDVLANSEAVLGFLLHNEQQVSIGQLPNSSVNWLLPESTKAYVWGFDAAIANIEMLQSAAIGGGFINAVGDPDGFIRRAALVARYQDQLYPSLALETARVYALVDEIETQTFEEDGVQLFQGIKLKDRWIETDEYGQVLIPYKGRQNSFPYYSATDVMTGRIGLETLAGTVAFIGTSAAGLADLRATPVGNQYPGVEVHANVFESLIHPEYMPFQPNESVAIDLLLTAITGLLLAYLLPKRSATAMGLIALSMLVFHVSFNWYLWVEHNVSLNYVLLLVLVLWLSIYFSTTAHFAESRNKEQMQEMFGQYVPPAYVEKLLVTGKSLKPERREMTVLFSDIRNFTAISERFTPEQLSDFLNVYLSHATETIFQNSGTVDKYVGDMVMAFWNAPLPDEKHAQKAVITALAMKQLTENLSMEFRAKNWPEIKTGTGISTGDMNVGDMGSKHRSSYTVLGDAVNLGARLESLTKHYGVAILVSEETYAQCEDLLFRYIDRVTVVGKDKPVAIYEPICLTAESLPIHNNLVKQNDLAFEAYYRQDWDQAAELFQKLQQQKLLTTRVYELFLANIESLKTQDLPSDWDGVTRHSKK